MAAVKVKLMASLKPHLVIESANDCSVQSVYRSIQCLDYKSETGLF